MKKLFLLLMLFVAVFQQQQIFGMNHQLPQLPPLKRISSSESAMGNGSFGSMEDLTVARRVHVGTERAGKFLEACKYSEDDKGNVKKYLEDRMSKALEIVRILKSTQKNEEYLNTLINEEYSFLNFDGCGVPYHQQIFSGQLSQHLLWHRYHSNRCESLTPHSPSFFIPEQLDPCISGIVRIFEESYVFAEAILNEMQ